MGDAENTIVPGVNEDLYNASRAFVAWCNEAGGIGGRRIEITIRDAALTQARERMSDACGSDFALVGGGLALDGSAVETRVDCGLVDFPGFVNDTAARQSDLQVVATSNYSYKDRIDVTRFRQIAAAHPDAITHFGTLLNSTLRGSGRGYLAQMADALEPLGYEYVYDGEFPGPPAVVDNWRPYVEEMRAAGVRVLDVYSSPEIVAPLEQAMRDVGWYPDVIILPANNYAPAMVNDALRNSYVGVYTHPFEEADDNPAVQQFLDIMDEHSPDWNREALAVNAFSAWLLFAKSAGECGADLTRQCVVERGMANEDWTGGGLTVPFPIDTKATPEPVFCGAIVRAEPDGFSLDEELTDANEGIYNCSTENSVQVDP